MASFNKFDAFVESAMEGALDLGSDQLMVVLTNTIPTANMEGYGDLSGEVANGNGYTTGGLALTTASSAQTSGTYKLCITDKDVVASGGSIGPFRYVVIYDDDAANDTNIGWYDYGSAITLSDGESLTIDFDDTNGVLTVA